MGKSFQTDKEAFSGTKKADRTECVLSAFLLLRNVVEGSFDKST